MAKSSKPAATSKGDQHNKDVDMKEASGDSRLLCGLVMPISAIDGCSEQHWSSVRSIIEEALESTPFHVRLVSEADDAGVIHNRIVRNLFEAEIVICDVSCKNPNVMFELGMRIAFDKPFVIVKDEFTDYSFDTSLIEHLPYPRDLNYFRMKRFKDELKFKVMKTYEYHQHPHARSFLKNFGTFEVASLSEREVANGDYILDGIEGLKREMSLIRNELRLGPNSYGNAPSFVYMAKSFFTNEPAAERYLMSCVREGKLLNPDEELISLFQAYVRRRYSMDLRGGEYASRVIKCAVLEFNPSFNTGDL